MSAILFMTDANTASVVSRSGRAGAAAAGIAAADNAIDGAIQAGSSAESVRRETVGSGQSDS